MNRLAAVLLVGGVVLLISWAVAPAAPVTSERRTAAFAELTQSTPVITEVNAQVDRLRERLAAPPQYPPPARDPFRFGHRPEPPRPATPEPSQLSPRPSCRRSRALPALVAIAANPSDGAVTRTAIFAEGEDVQLLKEGTRSAASSSAPSRRPAPSSSIRSPTARTASISSSRSHLAPSYLRTVVPWI